MPPPSRTPAAVVYFCEKSGTETGSNSKAKMIFSIVWRTLVGTSLERKNWDKLVNDAIEKLFWGKL
jgi:hypothetical protein